MKILIVGGTQFIGRAIAQSALDNGHELTIFHRGKTNPDLFPTAEHIIGDREHDLDRLRGRRWNVVIDTCGYVPRVVRLSAEALKGSVERYVFVSTISVYKDTGAATTTEDSELADTEGIESEEITGKTYGPLKVLCERVVTSIFFNQALIVRPGFVVGPYDSTDRMTYWVRRIAHAGKVLCPETGSQPMQCIDARDLGMWTLSLIQERVSGVFHATGPIEPILFSEFLKQINQSLGGGARLCFVNEELLKNEEVKPLAEFPFWIPLGLHSHQLLHVDISGALSLGLSLRPLHRTILDIYEWDRQRGVDNLKAGLDRQKEESVLLKLGC